VRRAPATAKNSSSASRVTSPPGSDAASVAGTCLKCGHSTSRTVRFRRRRLHNPTRSAPRQSANGVCTLGPALASRAFPLPWSHYVRLLAVRNPDARSFYEAEALRGGWSIRQLERQIGSQFYERIALSRNKVAMLEKGAVAKPQDAVTPEEEIKDPYVLEFLGLKDEYSESAIEEALIAKLETFLLELGGDFAFVGASAACASATSGTASTSSSSTGGSAVW
jgi:predicted nuclease of restriction endonuclease-like (RecB) superfamily